jgi:ssRNA-specific RNase YbeY (16S rRNA maturation enzyme)
MLGRAEMFRNAQTTMHVNMALTDAQELRQATAAALNTASATAVISCALL